VKCLELAFSNGAGHDDAVKRVQEYQDFVWSDQSTNDADGADAVNETPFQRQS